MFVTFYNLSHYHIKFQIVQPPAVRFDQKSHFLPHGLEILNCLKTVMLFVCVAGIILVN